MELSAYRQMAATEDRHWWFAGRRALARTVIARMNLPSGARILEVGAGTGGNLEMLGAFGDVTAVEMNELARSIGHEKTGRRFLAGHLPDGLPHLAGAFDLICLFDVLEHVGDDRNSIKALSGLLAENGRLLLTVPAHQWLWGRHDIALHHFRRYSRKMLTDTVSGSGLGFERVTFANTIFFPLAVCSRMLDRFRKSGESGGSAVPPAPLNAAMRGIYSLERHIISRWRLPVGVSLMAVLRRDTAAASSIDALPLVA